LPILLYGFGRPRAHFVGVLAELLTGAALAEQIPALVERLLQVPQTVTFLSVDRTLTGAMGVAQALLLLHELTDPAQNFLVVHRCSSAAIASHAFPDASWDVAILIDAPRWAHPLDGRRFAHLVSDTSWAELQSFVATLPLERPLRFHADHYDVPASSWPAVVRQGATVVTTRELVCRLRASGLRRSR
jgi:hypothetical protein